MHASMKAGLVALAALWAGAGIAQPPAPGNRPSHIDSLGILLDLTDAQKAQVQTILQAEHAQMQAQHAQIKQLFEQAKASGTKPDFQQMRTMHQQIQQETLQKLTPVLSAAQLKKFQVLARMGRHGHFGHGGPGGPPGATTPPPAQN